MATLMFELEDKVKKVVLSGASGKMGCEIVRALQGEHDLVLAGAMGHENSKALGKDVGQLAGVGELSIPVTDRAGIGPFDILIDFSRPEAIAENMELCVERGAAMLVGTTGLDALDSERISSAARHIPVLYAANTSIGVNLCAVLVETAARALGDAYDIEIMEAHHRHKVDAPSGTALFLGEAAATGRGLAMPDCGVFTREGTTGPREDGTIGFSTVRGGDIAGEHTVLYVGERERIEITHRAMDRRIFVNGALRAAKWLVSRPRGLYGMQDVLELE